MHGRLYKVFTLALSLIVLGACSKIPVREHRDILVMWNTDETDPAYTEWNKLLEKECRRQGVKAHFHYYYGNMGTDYEYMQRRRIASLVHHLDSIGHRPELILAHGDFIHWQLLQNPDSLLATIPMVCYGLKNETLEDYMYADLQWRQSPHKHMVEIRDSLRLKENLDFASSIEELLPAGKMNNYKPSYRFVSMLDFSKVWVDRIIHRDMIRQMNQLDTAQYLNCMERAVPHQECFAKNLKGVKSLAVASFKTPADNVPVMYHPLSWIFYRQKSMLRYIQIKHDEASRALVEGPNFGVYYTMTAEDFMVNDSCIGGYFPAAEALVRDAVTVGKELLYGAEADDYPRLFHRPDYHVNWDVLRPYGLKLERIPPYAQVHNVALADRNPFLANGLTAFFVVFFLVLIIGSTFYSAKAIGKQKQNRAALSAHARQAIYTDRILKLAIETCGSVMWDDIDEPTPTTLTLDSQWKSMLRSFYYQTEDGMYNTQFPGSFDGVNTHWYEVRMNIHHEQGKIRRSGFLLNIDHIKMVEAKARDSHKMLMDARAREGFISSMNHEIRTPLHAVVGFACELARPDIEITDEEIKLFSDIIDTNAAQLKKIINDILLVTLMNNATISAHVKKCRLGDLLDADLWPEALALASRRHNKLLVRKGDENCVVLADATMVATVMENLVSNASNFSEEGSTIRITSRKCAGGGAEISVTDEGIGLDPRFKDMVYERFFKVNSFSTGCGLGLYICKAYMDKMGGSIFYKNAPGRGTVFTIRFKG
ncbi:MAG: sensor histidine kinase [Candidatus Cryptobacteroides sp.]